MIGAGLIFRHWNCISKNRSDNLKVVLSVKKKKKKKCKCVVAVVCFGLVLGGLELSLKRKKAETAKCVWGEGETLRIKGGG